MNQSSDQTHLDELTADLAEFERRYGMTSDEFHRLYQAGQTDDRMDFVEWASLIQMAENLRNLGLDSTSTQGLEIPG